MREFKVYFYQDQYRGWGVGQTVCFVRAKNRTEVHEFLERHYGVDANIDMGFSEISSEQLEKELENIDKEVKRLKKLKEELWEID